MSMTAKVVLVVILAVAIVGGGLAVSIPAINKQVKSQVDWTNGKLEKIKQGCGKDVLVSNVKDPDYISSGQASFLVVGLGTKFDDVDTLDMEVKVSKIDGVTRVKFHPQKDQDDTPGFTCNIVKIPNGKITTVIVTPPRGR